MQKILILILGVTLIACTGNVSQTRLAIEEQQQDLNELKNDAIADHIDALPKWVTQTHAPDSVGIYAIGMGESIDLSLAIKKARLDAEFNLAKNYAQELSGTERLYASETSRSGIHYEGVMEKIVNKVPLVGYRVVDQEIKALRGKYAVFVLMQLPYDELTKVVEKEERLAASKEMQAAFKDLERRLDKRINSGENNQAN